MEKKVFSNLRVTSERVKQENKGKRTNIGSYFKKITT